MSQVFVQFVLEKDVNVAAQEVENRVQTVIPNLPETAKQPTVQKLDTDAAPVLRISVSAPTSLREVTEIAKHKIKERIESINGVGQITIIGGQERQINVWVDPDKMRSYNVTPAEVSGALKIQNMEFPSGRLDEGQKETSVRTVGKIQKPEEFNDVVVATRGGYQVKVKDLGYTEDGGEEIRSEARLNGQPAVTLIVSKQSGQNTVAVAREIKARLKEIEADTAKGLPDACDRRQLDLYRKFAALDRGALGVWARSWRLSWSFCFSGISARHLLPHWRSRHRSFRRLRSCMRWATRSIRSRCSR